VCDLCDGATAGAGPFLACSRACLETHLGDAHGPDVPSARERARRYQARVNRNVAGDRELFAGHRARVMALVDAVGHGQSLCVLGAGNGSDLDLPALAKTFASIHLVDFDGEALERCRDGLSAAVRERVVLHPDVDLTGFCDRLDAWGDDFPSEADLGREALPAIHGILQRLGQRFDVVASTGLLSQLAVPYHRAWVMPATSWGQLFAAITAVHLSTLAGATLPGGTGILIFDVLSSKNAPELQKLEGRARQDVSTLEAFVERHLAGGGVRLNPDPASLLARLQSPGLSRLVESPRLTAPWLWNIGQETQLVYGLLFQRP
jgi:hypothetical protein